jgi:hypothetical protein
VPPKHLHVVLDLDECEPIGLALPAEAPGTAASELRFREKLVGTINAINTVFTTTQFVDRSVAGKEEWVYYNGRLFEEGLGCDYVASESGGVGTGYDTFTFAFAPRPGDKVEIIYIPV